MTYNTISQNNDDHFYTAVCAYVRGEGNGIVPGTVGEEQAEIAKRLLRDSPAILDGKDRLLAEIAAIHYRESGAEAIVQEGGDYQSLFDDDDAWLDFSRPAAEVHRLVWAWRFTIPAGALHGALAELDGETVRVLASSLTEVAGARRVECADAPLWLVTTEPAPLPPVAAARA